MSSKAIPICRDLQGNVITINDLPPTDTVRWVANKKAILILAVRHSLVSRKDVLERYQMDEREFQIWEQEFDKYGALGLKNTKTQTRRK